MLVIVEPNQAERENISRGALDIKVILKENCSQIPASLKL